MELLTIVQDIIEVKQKPVYEVLVLDANHLPQGMVVSPDSFEHLIRSGLAGETLLCDERTLIKDLIKMVTCWITTPVDDPTTTELFLVDPNGSYSEQRGKWLSPTITTGASLRAKVHTLFFLLFLLFQPLS